MNIVEDFGVKIGWYIQCPKEYMKIYEYKRSKSFFDLSLRSFIFRQHLLKSLMANCYQISYSTSRVLGESKFKLAQVDQMT